MARRRTIWRRKKIGSQLVLFDCLTCDKCIPLCPNDANFSLAIAPTTLARQELRWTEKGWMLKEIGTLTLERPRQIATYADACNECGNCDVMCPEDGGPYLTKPLFFGSVESWAEAEDHDGFAFEVLATGLRMYGRFGERTMTVESGDPLLRFAGQGFDLRFDPADPAATVEGYAAEPVDLTFLAIMELLRGAVTGPAAANFLSAAIEVGRTDP